MIAEQRPPPPGVTDPYPNLAVIPKRPPPPNVTEQTRIGAGLEVDRVTAETAAAQDPLPQPHAAGRPAGTDRTATESWQRDSPGRRRGGAARACCSPGRLRSRAAGSGARIRARSGRDARPAPPAGR